MADADFGVLAPGARLKFLSCHLNGGILAMEKRKPSYDLSAIKAAIGSVETLSIKMTALRNAEALGYDDVGIVNVILGIERRMFVKSMTTFENHRLWQDVYHVPSRGLILYVKFQEDLLTEFAVVSFKEK
jgi:motility quorum-sensing regulator/GCU-specific mRNA interferase toxin